MKLFIIGVERYPDQCVIQKIDLVQGKYLMPKYFKQGNWTSWVSDVAQLIVKEQPTKVIFDEHGEGAFFKDFILKVLKGKHHYDYLDDGSLVYEQPTYSFNRAGAESPFTDFYRVCDSFSGRDIWSEVLDDETVLSSNEMEQKIKVGDKAYVVNHRGYRAFVFKVSEDELNWYYPPTKYKSEYYQDENADQLLWVIR